MQYLSIKHSYLARDSGNSRILYGCKPKKGDLQYEKYQKVFKHRYGFLCWFLQFNWVLQPENLIVF